MSKVLLALFAFLSVVSAQYQPTWESLDSRPLPLWYDEAKFGIFMHWGVYSVPSFGTEWFWYYWKTGNPAFVEFMKKNYPPNFQYTDFAPMFRAEFFDPDVWAQLLAMSGARYVVLTSKHHEGWTNWRSNVSWNWNSVDNGPHRDLVGDLAQAIRKNTNITFGLYHSLFEWFNPIYLKDQANNYMTQDYVKEVLLPELYDLVNTYKPEYIWSDGAVGPDTYWMSREFLAWLYNESPVKDTVVTNDRWCSNGCSCHHGGVYTCSDRYNPGKLINHKWENAMTVDKLSWGYRRNADIMDYLTIQELLYQLVSTVSCGGNLLMNVGPTADGRIIPAFQERLLQMGEWLSVNGEAIYSTKPWRAQNDTIDKNVWYTSKADAVYAIALEWPLDELTLGAPISTSRTQVTMLGYEREFNWKPATDKGGIIISVPCIPANQLKSKWAWVFKLLNVH
ncbi:Tissue alpha-L-fucosidase [Porites harrisoni]